MSVVLDNLEALNLAVGKVLALRMTTWQFKQTGGNEDAIRAKAKAMDGIGKISQTAAHEPQDIAATKIEQTRIDAEKRQKAALPKTHAERFAELGGEAELVKRGFPDDRTGYLLGQEANAVEVLLGKMTMKDLRDITG
jgi:hypothetical protein